MSFSCIKLRMAGLIIGYVGVVLSLFLIVMVGMALQTETQNEDFSIKTSVRCISETVCMETMQLMRIVMYFLILGVINYSLIIVGCATKKHYYLLPFLISKGFMLFCSATHSIFYVVTLNERTLGAWKTETLKFSVVLFMIFIWCLIFALYKRFRHRKINQNTHTVGLVPTDTKVPYKLQNA